MRSTSQLCKNHSCCQQPAASCNTSYIGCYPHHKATMKSSTTFQYLLCVTLATKLVSEAFTLSPTRGLSVSIAPVPSSALSAKKARRKRKEPQPGSEDLPDFDLDADDGALPDFDIEEDEPVKPAKKSAKATTELNFDEITDNMMGDGSKTAASLGDLISDRSLEKTFVFDDVEVDDSIPDLVDFARPSNPSSPIAPGSKAERREQRRAAAIARLEAEKESKFDIPFITDEKGKISGVKVLEAGAWAGIFLLVAWEVYLNSPFFDRAAPLAPVVFENP